MKAARRLLRHRLVAAGTGTLLALSAVTACSTGHDAYSSAVVQLNLSGGKSEYFYAANDRQHVNELAGPALTGSKRLSLSDYANRVVFLNFWASWCTPCQDEAAGLETTWKSVQPAGQVQFLGINIRDAQSDGQAYDAARGISYPSIFDPNMQTLLSFRGLPTASIPISMIIDKHGRVAYIWLRQVSQTEVASAIAAIANES